MRRVVSVFTLLSLLFISSPAGSVTDYGDPAVTRLWASTNEGDRFLCTASYIFPYISDSGSWVVTAGHCVVSGGIYLKQNADTLVLSQVNWRGVMLGDPRYTEDFNDIAIGTAPDARDGKHKRLWLADKMPEDGMVYIHGYPLGVERVSAGFIIPVKSEEAPGATLIAVRVGETAGGSSGAPVLNGQGQVVGIMWGLVPEADTALLLLPGTLAPGYQVALVTPVERLHELMKTLRVRK